MKKIFILLLTFISITAFSQKDNARYHNAWRLGLNLGGSWQTADYYSCWGMAGGFTLEKGLGENHTNFFSFAIRGRYLGANTYGMDFNRNYFVKSNDAYNGNYDPLVNFSDSLPSHRQYVFDNYKMTLGEGSLELQLSFNRLRERTGVILNLWGGVGVTSFRTMTDLLDGNKKMYDFSKIDSSGNQTKALNAYKGLIDKDYESYAYGSRHGNLVTFSPSGGIGLGYQFSPGFSLLLEYKITLPQGTNADLLDGKLRLNNDRIAGNKDYYHYTGLNFLFTLRGKKKFKSSPPVTETVNPNPILTTPVPSSSVVTNNPNPVSNNTAVPPRLEKPVISYVTPPTNAYSVTDQRYKISAKVLNVASQKSIQFKLNGVARNDFSYDLKSNVLSYSALLSEGTNLIDIVASNSAGTVSKQSSVVYEPLKAGGNPPLVSYINPVQAGSSVVSNSFNVLAQVSNVTEKKNIAVYFNGVSTPFAFNPANKEVSFTAPLKEGTNSISITANNTIGEDTKVTHIIYRKEKLSPPIVNLIDPAGPINNSSVAMYTFKLGVLNVSSKSDIEVLFNNNPQTNFTYSSASKELLFNTQLVSGSNILFVKATNSSGVDSKQIAINYSAQIEQKTPPIVSILTPSVDATTIMNPNFTFKATVSNVAGAQSVKVIFNGSPVTNFTFDGFNLVYPAMLVQGTNMLEVEAVNNHGSDKKVRSINFRFVKNSGPPTVNLKLPALAESSTQNLNYNFQFSVLNVSSKSGIQVSVNGIPLSNFNFDAVGKEVSFQSKLKVGENTVIVRGTNSSGTDFKQVKITYAPSVIIKNTPSVNVTQPGETEVLPIVSITSPSKKQVVFSPVYTFEFKVVNATKQQISVELNGKQVTAFGFNATIGSFSTTLVAGNNMLKVTASNSAGVSTKSESVVYRNARGTTGTIQPADVNPTDERKVTICHIPPGNEGNPQTITIPISALKAHLDHGDKEGECPNRNDSIRINNSGRGSGTPSLSPKSTPINPR
ncbi:MAG: hypothetical protein K0R26_1335 [Bacteroidota bacterium]|jgi:hypothetical protein|nr:hypothetical protein [Bacteroidota bacterium]